jgi:hypothetical protein
MYVDVVYGRTVIHGVIKCPDSALSNICWVISLIPAVLDFW